MDERDLMKLIGELRNKRQERKTVDAKRELVLKEDGEKAEFVKDVVSMANNEEPSYIVIGLEDGTFADVGPLSRHFTKNDLNQFLSDKIDPPVVVDYKEFAIGGNEYALIEIVGNNPPYIVASDLAHQLTDRKRFRIYKGTIYIRHEDRTEGISRAELEGLLKRRGLRKEYESETECAQQLALDRPDYWEFLLTEELLRSKLARVRRNFNELKRGLIFKKTTRIRAADFPSWASSKLQDLASLTELLNTIFNEEVRVSWGPPGEPGDPLEIKRAVDKIISTCDELLEWEADLHSAVLPDPLLTLKQLMEGWAAQVIETVEGVPDKLIEPFRQAEKPTGRYVVEIVFESPVNMNEFTAEIERLKSHLEEWVDEL